MPRNDYIDISVGKSPSWTTNQRQRQQRPQMKSFRCWWRTMGLTGPCFSLSSKRPTLMASNICPQKAAALGDIFKYLLSELILKQKMLKRWSVGLYIRIFKQDRISLHQCSFRLMNGRSLRFEFLILALQVNLLDAFAHFHENVYGFKCTQKKKCRS